MLRSLLSACCSRAVCLLSACWLLECCALLLRDPPRLYRCGVFVRANSISNPLVYGGGERGDQGDACFLQPSPRTQALRNMTWARPCETRHYLHSQGVCPRVRGLFPGCLSQVPRGLFPTTLSGAVSLSLGVLSGVFPSCPGFWGPGVFPGVYPGVSLPGPILGTPSSNPNALSTNPAAAIP